jgi:alkaline phosphatase
MTFCLRGLAIVGSRDNLKICLSKLIELTEETMQKVLAALLVLLVALASAQTTDTATTALTPTGNGAIFFHPDGTSASHWDAMRILNYGPDGTSNWDKLSEIAPYRGHLKDEIAGTSNAGAVIHATGTLAHASSFGLDEEGNEIVSANGTTNTVMEDALAAGLGTALLQTGSLIEPGTAAFVSEAERRAEYEEIALEVVESGVDIMLGAGEEWLLPEGVQGKFGEGARTDGRNLIEAAATAGYTVVYTRDELLALPETATKVLGVFNVEDTFYDMTEGEARAEGLPYYLDTAPTIAEMMAFALPRVSANEKGFLIVAEEEGTDNMCNNGNAGGCLEALKRADNAFRVIAEFTEQNPNTFMVTTSDSNAGGMQVVAAEDFIEDPTADSVLPGTADNGAPIDGVEGTESKVFVSAPDASGEVHPFAISWTTYGDVGSGVIARAHGLNAAEMLPASGVKNSDIYKMLYMTLFGEDLRQTALAQ